ncbi:MAG: hypothetical protein AAGI46_05465 [Planctomycetota bacterium]
MFTAIPGLADSKRRAPDRPGSQFDLGEHEAFLVLERNEAVVGTEIALTADPVIIEARRSLQANDDVGYASSRASAGRVIVIELAVPGEDDTLGTNDIGLAAADVRVLDQLGDEIFPADGSAGKRVTAKIAVDEVGDPNELRRESYRMLGRKIGAMFTGSYDR